MKLTDLSLRALPFEDGQRDYTDDAVKGLSVRVGRRTKTFLLMIRRADSRERVTLGQYDPPHFTLSLAREKARDLLAEARIKKDEPVATTFSVALAQFIALHVPTMRRLTQRECTRILRTRFTALSHRRLTDLKTSELATLLDGIAAPAERRSAFVWLRTFLNWAYSRGYLDTNPITRLKPPPLSRPRERVLSDQEIVKVWHASYSATPPQYGALVRLLILSLQRKGQWEQFRPEFIHLDKIIFPSEVMKGAREHTIPLTPLMKQTIGNHTFKGWNAGYAKQKLDKLSGVRGFTLHDLRRTGSTKLAELGIAPHVIERILAHQTGTISGVAAVYNRFHFLPEMKAAFQELEKSLHALVSTTEGMNG